MNPLKRNIAVDWFYLDKRYKSLLNFTRLGRWEFGTRGLGIGSGSWWLLWLGTKSTNTHSVRTLTLGTGMLKGTSRTITTLVKFEAKTFRDTTGLRRVWPKGISGKRLLLRCGLLWSHPEFPMDAWLLKGKLMAHSAVNNGNSHSNNANHVPGRPNGALFHYTSWEREPLWRKLASTYLNKYRKTTRPWRDGQKLFGLRDWFQGKRRRLNASFTTWYSLSKTGLVAKAPKSINFFFRIFARRLADRWASTGKLGQVKKGAR